MIPLPLSQLRAFILKAPTCFGIILFIEHASHSIIASFSAIIILLYSPIHILV